VKLGDAALPMLTITLLSPVAFVCFRIGIPIEVIVFGLLLAGYKGPNVLNRVRKHPQPGIHEDTDVASSDEASLCEQAPPTQEEIKSKSLKSANASLHSWRSNIPWRSKGNDDGRRGKDTSDDTLSWRSKASTESKPRKGRAEETLPKGDRKSALSALKKNTPQLQWRSIINKFTPEKFDRLCEQLLATLPTQGGGSETSSEEFKQVLNDLLALIFEASSRQHQYTEMYTDLCQKLLDFVAKQQPDLDGKSCIWEKCQHIFLNTVLKTPDIPTDIPEDEYLDRKAKHKHMMVGMVKFGGDLVSHGLVPCEGVMQWIHTLLSEKNHEVPIPDSDSDADGEVYEKDLERREVQLEVLCAILASMGSSLSDSNTWSDENRLVIEDVFSQLEQLSMDTENLSLRIRCLIRDILDLRMAHWKEKEGKLKPAMLQPRKKDGDDDQLEGVASLREDAPEGKPWLDPQLLCSLQSVEHHLEVIEDKDLKLQRLKALIQLYHLIQEQQVVIVANSSNVRKVLDLINESFTDVDCKALDFSTPEQTRKKNIKGFETGETSILIMASEVSTRRDFDFNKPASVLVNFDFPMTLQLYLYRIFKRADSNTHVYTFFSPQFDVRHTTPLIVAMDGARQKIPPALQKLKEQIKSESSGAKRDQGNRRTPKNSEFKAEQEEDNSHWDNLHPWKQKKRRTPPR